MKESKLVKFFLEEMQKESIVDWPSVQQALIYASLIQFNGNRTRAAAYLGISVRTIRNKIDDYGFLNLQELKYRYGKTSKS